MHSLSKKCVETKFDKYLYKICPFESIHQDVTLLGTFGVKGGWKMDRVTSGDININEPEVIMYFNNGQPCGSYGSRKATLHLRCSGDDEYIVSAIESDVCRYVFIVNTPSVCVENHLKVMKSNLKKLEARMFHKAKKMVIKTPTLNRRQEL